jgi:hypothetical protein
LIAALRRLLRISPEGNGSRPFCHQFHGWELIEVLQLLADFLSLFFNFLCTCVRAQIQAKGPNSV